MKIDKERKELLDAHEHDSHLLDDKEEKMLVRVGRIAAGASLVIGVIVAPLLGNLDQAFQYIQEYTGFISPGVVAIFLLGMFWKRTSTTAALAAVIAAIPLSAGFKFFMPELPFIDRMGLCFLLITAMMVVISLVENKDKDPKAIEVDPALFKTDTVFNLATVAICGILAAIYIVWW